MVTDKSFDDYKFQDQDVDNDQNKSIKHKKLIES